MLFVTVKVRQYILLMIEYINIVSVECIPITYVLSIVIENITVMYVVNLNLMMNHCMRISNLKGKILVDRPLILITYLIVLYLYYYL